MATKLYGDDLKVLEEKSRQIETLANETCGAVDIFRGQFPGQIYLQIEIRPPAIARFGINIEDINRPVATAMALIFVILFVTDEHSQQITPDRFTMLIHINRCISSCT